MNKVYEGVYVGDSDSCFIGTSMVVVHACKFPCYHQMVGKVPKDHPDYFYKEEDSHLFLNMVDVPNPAFFQIDTVQRTIDFLHEHYLNHRKILIHCNWGYSRSASLALLFLAKKLRVVPDNYLLAKEAFLGMYPDYNPTRGIDLFLNDNWEKFS